MLPKIKSILRTYRMSIGMGTLLGLVHIVWMELQLSGVFKRPPLPERGPSVNKLGATQEEVDYIEKQLGLSTYISLANAEPKSLTPEK